MFTKFQINKNLIISTADKHHPTVIFVDGSVWVEPKEGFDIEGMKESVIRKIKKTLPKSIVVLELTKFAQVGGIYLLTYQIGFQNSEMNFKNCCEKITPLIHHRIPRFLRVIEEYGFSIHSSRDGN